MKFYVLLLAGLFIVCNVAFAEDLLIDFEDRDIMEAWVVIDEPPALLNDLGPSNWVIESGPIDGKALNQTSNIWGDPPDEVALGTFIIYDLVEFEDFDLTVDTLANDNDGMGIVWGWKSRTDHYRFFTMQDAGNPAGAKGGNNDPGKAPWAMIEKRTGDDSPYYDTLVQKKEAAYSQGALTTFNIVAKEGKFEVYANDKFVVDATDKTYTGGKIGFTLYAQSGCYFDNLKVVYSIAVDVRSKLASTWGSIKR